MQENPTKNTYTPTTRRGDVVAMVSPDVNELLRDQERLHAMQARLTHMQTLYV